jgi:hypothetical protein
MVWGLGIGLLGMLGLLACLACFAWFGGASGFGRAGQGRGRGGKARLGAVGGVTGTSEIVGSSLAPAGIGLATLAWLGLDGLGWAGLGAVGRVIATLGLAAPVEHSPGRFRPASLWLGLTFLGFVLSAV